MLTRGRFDAEEASRSALQARVDAARLGLVITGVTFQDVHPPLSVVDAYRDVSRAETDRLRKIAEGTTERETRLTLARSLAFATIQRAEADRQGRADRASGVMAAVISVSIKPGAIAFTRIFLDPSSFATDLVSAISPALLAA